MSWLFSDRPGTEQELTVQAVRALGLDGISSLLLFASVATSCPPLVSLHCHESGIRAGHSCRVA